jgi:glucose-6-phosphate 1-dehydrogenase
MHRRRDTSGENMKSNDLNIIILGASGDLARKKIFPALFSLFCQGFLPDQTKFFGFSRSSFTHKEFRKKITADLTCRYTPGESCAGKMDEFLSKCFYQEGSYESCNSFLDLYSLMSVKSDVSNASRLFYYAIPPSLFAPVAKAIGDSGLVLCDSSGGVWSRTVIEKPFGRDRESSDKLTKDLSEVFVEDQIYRIDHYLGKEMVQNIQVTRFANEIFKPLWNAAHIAGVEINWSEDIGVEGRGGYFDNYGIIRDVVQNHLLQIVALIAMDEPRSLAANHVRNQKVRLLRSITTLTPDDVIIGQYSAGELNGKSVEAYRDDPTVADDSITPTFAKVTLEIDNERWRGVPFTIRAGKGMSKKISEIRIRFRVSDSNLFCATGVCPPPNELIIRIQPDEGIHLNIVNKVPGIQLDFHTEKLNLSYGDIYKGDVIPDAYESLILDVIKGEKSLFIRKDELEAAWDIFTPVLHHLEDNKIEPKEYPFGTNGVLS